MACEEDFSTVKSGGCEGTFVWALLPDLADTRAIMLSYTHLQVCNRCSCARHRRTHRSSSFASALMIVFPVSLPHASYVISIACCFPHPSLGCAWHASNATDRIVGKADSGAACFLQDVLHGGHVACSCSSASQILTGVGVHSPR